MTTSSLAAHAAVCVVRFEVSPLPGQADPIGAGVARDASASLGLHGAKVVARHVYLVQGALGERERQAIAQRLLADPVTERVHIGASAPEAGASLVEVHPLPGVMDPVAQSVELAIRDLLELPAGEALEVMSGWRYDISGLTAAQVDELASRLLANPVIQRVTREPYAPARFARGRPADQRVREVKVSGLNDEQLARLSREAHLFLSAEEMRAVQAHFGALGREPREIELETLAQTWSEHCVHKTLKSRVRYREAPGAPSAIAWHGRPGTTVHADGTVEIDNLLKRTVAAATFELIDEGIDWTLSVFKDNSGVIALSDEHGVCIKVETHNRPSAIEPYGGAATGIGGCIRDVVATGLGARPIASTDVFCVAPMPGAGEALPPGALHPRRILTQVVAGVRDYGNRMGIPTVSGAVAFDPRYVGNPLVFCGCIGLIPRGLVQGRAQAGDRVIALGGRTGRDGVHGATFSSAQLEQNAADEFGHAVQIGNAITQKQLLDAVMRARDEVGGPLYHGMTDCGAGGFSSAIGEMGSQLGAEVHLDRAPLKYAGLSFTEVWISEAQERLVLAVPERHVARLREICAQEGVDFADLGHFGTPGHELVLRWQGAEVGRLSMDFLHEGIPMPTREARWNPGTEARVTPGGAGAQRPHIKDALLALLGHPNIASKHWIIRQYDHEVGGRTVVKPLVGPAQRGPADASVIEPVPALGVGIALACGLQTPLGDGALGGDPYDMTLAAIDECVRNLVCAGADPSRTAILDNFCWPSCAREHNMAALARACAACYDGAKAYRTPFVSGKDSLNNQLRYTDPATGQERVIEIPYTLLITGMGVVHDVQRCVTSDAKGAGNALIHVGRAPEALGASHLGMVTGQGWMGALGALPPRTDLRLGPATARAVATLIERRLVASAHDVSDGGLLCCVAEMLIGGAALGARLHLDRVHSDQLVAAFSEGSARYVLEVRPQDKAVALALLADAGVPAAVIGRIDHSGVLTDASGTLSAVVGDLAQAWLKPLDW
jgi:phosphoribosylformylglycinamidine synthase II